MNDEDKNPKQYDSYEENLRRLKLRNRYNENPRSEEDEEEERNRFRNAGENTFISYEDLEKMAKNGEEFFLPPDKEDKEGNRRGFSCGDGRFYKGSLKEIHNELQSSLKADPGNEKIKAGLDRINREFLANPGLAFDNKKTEDESETQDSQYTSPTPFSTKPKMTPY